MDSLIKKLKNMRLSSLHKHLNSNIHLSSEEKIDAHFFYFHTNQQLKKRRGFCLDPFDYKISTDKLKQLSEFELMHNEMKHLFEEDDTELPLWLHKKLSSCFKAALTEVPSPVEVYISEKNAQQIFGITLSQLHLYRKSGLIKVANQNESYCYPWTQLQELFS